MPDIKYPKNSNSDTVFVEDGAQRTRAVKTVQPDGTIDYPTNPNSDSCYVTVDGEKQRALMVADISSAGTIEYPTNPNSTKGYVNINGTKQRVSFTANIAGGGSTPVIDELNVTPSTSAQVITAPTGTDGYSPVNVSAVDASIDANITAGNIKSGTTILGVTGSVVELNGETASVTPTTSSQTITPTSPKNAFTEITVNAVTSSIDANIQAGNIKDGVTILGVTGTYSGGAPTYYIQYKKGSGDTLYYDSFIINLTGIKDIGNYVLESAYKGNVNISGAFTANDLVKITGLQAMRDAFYNSYSANTITSASFSSLETITGQECLYQAFYRNNALISVTMNNLKKITGDHSCSNAFAYCPLTSGIDLSSLEVVSGYESCSDMFMNSGITILSLPKMTYATGIGCFVFLCENCTSLNTAELPSLSRINGSGALSYAFSGASNLTTLKLPAITTTSFGYNTDQFEDMCSGVTNITLHFPSNVQSVIEGLTGYSVSAPFGADSGTVLFDLPATVILTGTNSQSYERNPKDDTLSALAWRKKDTGSITNPTIDWTSYYTSGTSDPAVSDTIYSDAACTTPVTTISSIA